MENQAADLDPLQKVLEELNDLEPNNEVYGAAWSNVRTYARAAVAAAQGCDYDELLSYLGGLGIALDELREVTGLTYRSPLGPDDITPFLLIENVFDEVRDQTKLALQANCRCALTAEE